MYMYTPFYYWYWLKKTITNNMMYLLWIAPSIKILTDWETSQFNARLKMTPIIYSLFKCERREVLGMDQKDIWNARSRFQTLFPVSGWPVPTSPVKWMSSTCWALSLWATFCRRAQQARRGSWSRSWSMSCCSSSSSTFTWWSIPPTDPWRAYSLTLRWAAGELSVVHSLKSFL